MSEKEKILRELIKKMKDAAGAMDTEVGCVDFEAMELLKTEREAHIQDATDSRFYREWLMSDIYWLRSFTAAALAGGADGRTAVASSAAALGAIAASEKLAGDES